MLSLYGAESPDGRRAEVGTVSDFFRLLGRSWVFWLVVCDSRSPCACFKPMWSVRRGQGTTFYHFWSRVTKRASSCHTVYLTLESLSIIKRIGATPPHVGVDAT